MGRFTILPYNSHPLITAITTLLERNERIVAADSSVGITIPPDAQRVSLAGKTVVPGLMNSHGHVTDARDLAAYATYGATTVFSLGDEGATVLATRDNQNSLVLQHSRVKGNGVAACR